MRLVALLLAGMLVAGHSDGQALAQAPTATPFDAAALEAQSQGLLQIGEGTAGELTAETLEQWWTLPLIYGDTVFITVNAHTGSALYPQLTLVGPVGDVLTQVDNPSASPNALIASFTAPQDGPHYLRVAGLYSSVGGYTVRVGRLPATPVGQATPTAAATIPPTSAPAIAPTLPPATGGSALRVGQSVEATLPPGERHAYTFEGEGGLPVIIDLVALEASPAALDPYLELYGPGGTFLYANDDLEYGMINARLEVILPTAGTYTVVVRSYGDRSGGMYSLSLRVGALWKR